MLQEIAEAARWFDSHRELRVVIVSGAGQAFCAGADLKDSSGAAARQLEKAHLSMPGCQTYDAIAQHNRVYFENAAAAQAAGFRPARNCP
jgi:enoyl-CoA hydratase/carnithine racemase